MRKFVLTMAALAAILAGGLAVAPKAEAMPVSGIAAAVAGDGLLQKAAYTCRPIWRCGRYGCGWRRVCYWTPRVYYGRPYYWGRHYHHRRYW